MPRQRACAVALLARGRCPDPSRSRRCSTVHWIIILLRPPLAARHGPSWSRIQQLNIVPLLPVPLGEGNVPALLQERVAVGRWTVTRMWWWVRQWS